MLKEIKFLLCISLLVSIISCSTVKETHTIEPQTEINPLTLHQDSLLQNLDSLSHTTLESDGDSLEFIQQQPVDVRWNLNDTIESHFTSNLDSLLNLWAIKHSQRTQKSTDASISFPSDLPDSVYIKRLEQIPSGVSLSYNKIVKNYIKLYTQRRRKQVGVMLGLAEYYFPIFEEILDREGLPQELKYLPIIESALNPRALSRAGASGLWQFMYGTGKMYKLNINSLVDERRDPIQASIAAVKFLKDLYRIYGDWQLVIAAYNCGPGNVNKAIRRSGGKRNYWDIYYRLPRETRGYVPAFIAATYAFNYSSQHNLKAQPCGFPLACDTIMVNKQLHFDQISAVLNIPKEQLREMNPQYRADIIPANHHSYALKIPMARTSDFIDLQDSIYAYKKTYYFNLKDKIVNPRDRYQKYAHSTPKNRSRIYYKVKSGDAIGLIASWFHIRTSDLRYWNNIRRNLIKVGQRLVVYVPKNKANFYKRIDSMSFAQKQATRGKKVPVTKTTKTPIINGNFVYHTVRRGENLWTIARKFPGVSNLDIMKLNNIKNAKNLKVGQRLKIKQKS